MWPEDIKQAILYPYNFAQLPLLTMYIYLLQYVPKCCGIHCPTKVARIKKVLRPCQGVSHRHS